MGSFLATYRLRHGDLVALARTVGVSPRTLRNWRDREGRSGSPGRPRHGEAVREAAREHTERAWRALPSGQDGWRSVCEVHLREGLAVPLRLVQESLRALKREQRARERTRIAEQRVHVEVLARDALWSLDQMHVSRDEQGALKALAVRDGLSPHTLGLSLGPPPGGQDVMRLLGHTAAVRGAWPLVLQVDNGPENKNADVERCLRSAQVIVLWNEPRTPEHNPRIERSIGSLRRASGLGKRRTRGADPSQGPVCLSEAGVLETRTSLCARLLHSWRHLDETPRAGLLGLTPVELDRLAPRAEDLVCRARFYREVCEELRRVALEPIGARARRKLERETIWNALQRFGLVTRTRGGRLVPTVKAEGIS